jgi:hypothetical protein
MKSGTYHFWSRVFKLSFVALFRAKETADNLRGFLWKWAVAIIIGLGAIATLGWRGWLTWAGINTLTLGNVIVSALVLRFLSNLLTVSANLYFDQRRIADKLSWEDVRSSVWEQPEGHPLLVGVRLERDEAHTVQSLRAALVSIVGDGQYHFKGNAETILPIRKPDGIIAWMKSFNNERPRNFLLASVSGDKMLVKFNDRQAETLKEFGPGKYDVEIQFSAEGGVAGHNFRGILVFDGKSVGLKKLR